MTITIDPSGTYVIRGNHVSPPPLTRFDLLKAMLAARGWRVVVEPSFAFLDYPRSVGLNDRGRKLVLIEAGAPWWMEENLLHEFLHVMSGWAWIPTNWVDEKIGTRCGGPGKLWELRPKA